MKISNILEFQDESSGSCAAEVGGITLASQQAASLLELGAHFPLWGEQDRSLCCTELDAPLPRLLEPAMDRAAPHRARECSKIPFWMCWALFPSPHPSGQCSPSHSLLLLAFPVRPGARGCGAVQAGARAPYLAPGWLSLTAAAPGLPVAVYGAAAPGAAADLS